MKTRSLKDFKINCYNEDTLALYNDLVDRNDGEVLRKSEDFDIRKGITKEPITNSDQYSITITHSYINVTSWFLKVFYRLNVEYFAWPESKIVPNERI